MIWNVVVPVLVVAVLVLLWRVRRLEVLRDRVDGLTVNLQQEAIWRTTADSKRPDFEHVDHISRRVTDLAAALGYEWKSTPAKSGWEKKASLFGLGPLAGKAREEAISRIEHAINTTPSPFASSLISYYECGDRRKGGDRRKPVAEPKAARTGAKRGPKRATH